jgi:hypothetical protein
VNGALTQDLPYDPALWLADQIAEAQLTEG